MTYNVWQNSAAGEAVISDLRPGYHFDFIGKYETRQEAEAKLTELAGPDVWVVFVNHPEHSGYVSRENNTSGNWDGSRDYPYEAYADFPTKEKARAALNEYLKCDSAKNGTYCYSHNREAN